jgi:hypothetical protein
MLHPFISDFIAFEIELCECLYEMRKSWMMDEEIICLTVLFRNPPLRCCAPSSPISLYPRLSCVIVCMKWERVEWWMKRVFLSLCSFVMHHLDVVPLHLRFHCLGGWVVWVSVWNEKELNDEWREYVPLCWFLMHHSDIAHLQLRFHCIRRWVVWVSVWNEKELNDGWREYLSYCVVS